MAFCPNCGAQIQDNSTFCGSCGKSVNAAAPTGYAAAQTPVANGGMADNVAGLLAYLFIPAIIFLLVEPYKKSRFVRFHSFQCLFFAIAWFVLWFLLTIVTSVVGVFMFFLYPIISLAGLALGIFLMIKAYQGQIFKLPMIGDLAEKQANAV